MISMRLMIVILIAWCAVIAPASADAETPELDALIQFLDDDLTDEITYHYDPNRGMDHFVCTGFTRALAENASKHNITLGAIGVRDYLNIKASRYRHAMNYVIADGKFYIIEPQDDWIYELSDMQFYEGNVVCATLFPNAQIMINFQRHKSTIDIDFSSGYNEIKLVEKWGL